jgi:hypothetical protein
MTRKSAAMRLVYWSLCGFGFFTTSEAIEAYRTWKRVGSAAAFNKIFLNTAPTALARTIGFAAGCFLLTFALQVVRRNGGWSFLRRSWTLRPRRDTSSG